MSDDDGQVLHLAGYVIDFEARHGRVWMAWSFDTFCKWLVTEHDLLVCPAHEFGVKCKTGTWKRGRAKHAPLGLPLFAFDARCNSVRVYWLDRSVDGGLCGSSFDGAFSCDAVRATKQQTFARVKINEYVSMLRQETIEEQKEMAEVCLDTDALSASWPGRLVSDLVALVVSYALPSVRVASIAEDDNGEPL